MCQREMNWQGGKAAALVLLPPGVLKPLYLGLERSDLGDFFFSNRCCCEFCWPACEWTCRWGCGNVGASECLCVGAWQSRSWVIRLWSTGGLVASITGICNADIINVLLANSGEDFVTLETLLPARAGGYILKCLKIPASTALWNDSFP